MPRASTTVRFETLADILDRMGGIDPARVRATPKPGQATQDHLIRLNERKNRLYELADGVLVERATGVLEGWVTARIIARLGKFLDANPIGMIVTPDIGTRLMPGLIRLPDVS